MLVAIGMWDMHQWNEQRNPRSFYDMFEKGQISVILEEQLDAALQGRIRLGLLYFR
ncbi:hypothetical protein ZWY2020_015072 [Hordeum vulgare]|nr:hypothetical protein ZWY2020_015072 [Hordeum vulgare]